MESGNHGNGNHVYGDYRNGDHESSDHRIMIITLVNVYVDLVIFTRIAVTS